MSEIVIPELMVQTIDEAIDNQNKREWVNYEIAHLFKTLLSDEHFFAHYVKANSAHLEKLGDVKEKELFNSLDFLHADLSGLSHEEKKKIVDNALAVTGHILYFTFKSLGLKTHIKGVIANKGDLSTEYHLSFTKVIDTE